MSHSNPIPVRTLFGLSTLCFVLMTAACSPHEAAVCVDEACPVGQACGVSGCEPLQVPTELGDLGRYTRARVDSSGHLVVATYDSTHGNLVLMRQGENKTVQTILVDGFRVEAHAVVETDSGRFPSLALDESDNVHLSWYDADNGELRYAAIAHNTPWQWEVVDGAGASDRGKHSSLAVAEDGSLHIAYRDDTTKSLRYATKSAAGLWESRAVTGCSATEECPLVGEENYGEYASLALIAGQARIVFYDRLRGDLKLASQSTDGGFTVTTLDGSDPVTGVDTGDVGRFAKVAVDPKRRLAVAYFDATGKSLRYLFEGSGSLQANVIDFGLVSDEATGTLRTHVVGQHVALRFDPQGRALLMYLDATALKIKRAMLIGEKLIESGFIEGLPAGGSIDFDITPNGNLKGAYGAWLPNAAPRTTLETFELDAVMP
jgi:hypothetical protein